MMLKNELKILIGLHRAVSVIDKKTSDLCRNYNLTLNQFGVLEALFHKGDMTIGQVQEKILSSCGTMPIIVKNLQNRNLIKVISSPKDKRKKLLSLTKEGRDMISHLYPKNESMIVRHMAVLSDEDKEVFVSLLKKMNM